MQKASLCFFLAALAGGCAETVSAEKFLYMYRRGASPGHIEDGWYAEYTGQDDGYHYLKVQHSTLDRGAGQVLLYGGFREEILRSPEVVKWFLTPAYGKTVVEINLPPELQKVVEKWWGTSGGP